MLHHYITRYEEDGRRYAEAWLQVDLFGRSWCFSRRRVEVGECAVVEATMPDEQPVFDPYEEEW